ncbi:hypothetical protein BST83_08840 [Polaribacter filamentus]|uniref:Uncharacterized protein n=1 Tax=Polaribacter filamentus TaxID=53483 RepID=A0A2S7KX82_9FLAO|nr:hypothetical protein BST83_08840 [Polaribacter filamentus]
MAVITNQHKIELRMKFYKIKKIIIVLGIIGLFIGGVLIYNNHIENKYRTPYSTQKKRKTTILIKKPK